MVIGVDIDDVVAALLPAWIERYNCLYHDDLSLDEITQWDLIPYVDPACGRAIYDLLTDDLYDQVQPVPGAMEGVEALRAAGHRVIFVTAGTPKGPDPLRKFHWLQEWSLLPDDVFISPDYVVAYDKGLVNADILIDDKPENCEAFAARSGKAIVFSQNHNVSYIPGRDVTRAATWADVLALILGDKVYQTAWVHHDPAPEWTETDEAIFQYNTGGRVLIDGFEYEPWTTFWTALPVAGDLVQRPGDLYRFYATRWWRRADAGQDVRQTEKPDPFITVNLDELTTGHETPEDLARGGVKYDTGKSRFDLLPPFPLMELARLFTIGTRKYADRNWEKGMPYGKVFSALMRHAWKWWAGDELDHETLVHHLTSVAWCAFVLLEYTATHPEFDDRPDTDDEHINDTLIAAQVDPYGLEGAARQAGGLA